MPISNNKGSRQDPKQGIGAFPESDIDTSIINLGDIEDFYVSPPNLGPDFQVGPREFPHLGHFTASGTHYMTSMPIVGNSPTGSPPPALERLAPSLDALLGTTKDQ